MPFEDEGRIGALHRHGIPGNNLGDALDRIVKVALAGTGAPIAAVTAVERTRQTFLAVRGMADLPLALDQSFCAATIRNSKPLIVNDATLDAEFAGLDIVTGEPGIRSYLGVPVLSADGYALGTICIMDTRPRAYSEEHMTIMVNLARLVVSHLASRQPDNFDFLTGAITRRRFQAEVEREFDRAIRYERPACLVFVDIDHFRVVNETLGPAMADEVLKAVANRSREALRTTDVFGRIGGEEFGMLLPETLAYEASQCAERIRETISKLRFRDQRGVTSVTASFGLAPLNPSIKSAMQWFAQADIGLITAKRSGRDCVAFAPPAEAGLSNIPDDGAAPETGIPKLH